MKIRVKLYAMLSEYLPAEASRNEVDLEVPEGATPKRVLMRLGLPEEVCHLVLVNGSYVAPEDRGEHSLQEGDHLAVWPPVAGG